MLDANNLLRSLREEDRVELARLAEPIEFERGHVFYEPGDEVKFAYFPADAAMASFLVVLDDRPPVETVLIGREGAVGGIVNRGLLPAFTRSEVLNRGTFFRISSVDLDAVKQQTPALLNLLSRYADCLLAQIFQSVACNASHSLVERAARWLTASIDRTGRPDIAMTQHQFASIMGVGRSYTSLLLQKFKTDDLIRTRRGGITVTDPKRLAAIACGCDRLVAGHFEKVLKGVYPD